MYCKNCGAALKDSGRFCPGCGMSVQPPAPVEAPKTAPETKVEKPKRLLAPALLSIVPMLLSLAVLFVVGGIGFFIVFIQMLPAAGNAEYAGNFLIIFWVWCFLLCVSGVWFCASLLTLVHSLKPYRGGRRPLVGMSFLLLAGAYLMLACANALVYRNPDIVMFNNAGLKAFLESYRFLLGDADAIAASLVCFVSMLLASIAAFQKRPNRVFGIIAAAVLLADGVYLTIAWVLRDLHSEFPVEAALQLLLFVCMSAAMLIIHLCQRPQVGKV